jgi:hypothetical protein
MRTVDPPISIARRIADHEACGHEFVDCGVDRGRRCQPDGQQPSGSVVREYFGQQS